MNSNTPLSPDNLPLDVREHLMRGQQQQAIETLVSNHAMSEDDAKQLLESYREKLRERKLALDIQVMQAENSREEEESKQVLILWGTRIAVVFVLLIVLIVLLK